MRRRITAGAALVLALIVLVAAIAGAGQGNRPTSYSTLAKGYYAAYHYLERRGVPVVAFERELAELPESPGLLIIAAPTRLLVTEEDQQALSRWLARGGNAALLPSGERPGVAETALLLGRGLSVERVRDDPPWRFSEWVAWRQREQSLRPAEPRGVQGIEPVSRVGTHTVSRPGGARTLLVDDDGASAAFEIDGGAGRVVVLNNASILSNALLREADNLDLLEWLVAEYLPAGGSVLFDEWHHGHRAASAEARRALVGPIEFLGLHLVLLYLLVVVALARPFGPRVDPGAARTSSTARWLLSLASLHRRLGHAEQAGALLLASCHRMRRRGARGGETLAARFEGGERELLALAREIGQLQQEKKL